MSIVVTYHQLVGTSCILQHEALLVGVSPGVHSSAITEPAQFRLGVHVGSLLVIPQKVLVAGNFPARQQKFAGVQHFCASELENSFLGRFAFFDNVFT